MLYLKVQCWCDFNTSVETNFSITVLDANDPPTVLLVNGSTGIQVASLKENTPKGSIVGQLLASDQVNIGSTQRTYSQQCYRFPHY